MFESRTISTIVVLRPNHRLGNALLLTPLVRELQNCFPAAKIEYVGTGAAAGAVFKRFEQVTAVHSFPLRSYRDPARVLALLVRLKRRTYDLAIDPCPHSRAGRFLLGQVSAPMRLGFLWGDAGRDRMLTHAVSPRFAPAHCATSPVYLLRSMLSAQPLPGADGGMMSTPLELRLTESEREDGRRRLASAFGSAGPQRPTLGIFVNATGEKCFPVAWWSAIVAALRRQDPILQLLEFTPADGRARLGGGVKALHTSDLRLLGATLAATSLITTADCGVMHLADAAGARVLGLFRSSEPARYGPAGPSSRSLMTRADGFEEVVAAILEAVGSRCAIPAAMTAGASQRPALEILQPSI